MSKICHLCNGAPTIFYIWNTSRGFDRRICPELFDSDGKPSSSRPVCFSCYYKRKQELEDENSSSS